MTKIREILFKTTNDWENVNLYTVETAIKKYAEYYAKLVLEKAANECVTDYTYVDKFTSKESFEVETYVIRSSITNIKLPNHE